LAVEVGRAYADERKLLKDILVKVSLDGKSCTIGNRLYGMDSQLARVLIEMEGLIPVIPVKDGLRNRVRDRYRRRLKEIYEKHGDVYRDRYRVEQFIGKVKNAYGDRDNTRSYDLACVFVLMRFLLYNIALLLALFIWLIRFFKQA